VASPPRSGIKPVKQLKLADAVAAQLEELIRQGHFGNSGRLPAERVLADQFGVGRGTMREAVSKLETLGIVTKSQGVGTFAVYPPPSPGDHLLMLTAGDVTALELFEVRYALEPDASALAATRRTEADMDEIRAILERSMAPGIDAATFVALDFEFHNRVVQASKNRLLRGLHEQVGPHHAIYSTKVISIPGRMERACEGHQQILEAIVQRDVEGARNAALTHLRSAERDLARAASQRD
jgi:GntR family transcriptional repressor for pyruvate dehydrogenase complex